MGKPLVLCWSVLRDLLVSQHEEGGKKFGADARFLDQPLLATSLSGEKKHTRTHSRNTFKALHDVAPLYLYSGLLCYPFPHVNSALARPINPLYTLLHPCSLSWLLPFLLLTISILNFPIFWGPVLTLLFPQPSSLAKLMGILELPPLSSTHGTFCLLHTVCFCTEDRHVCSLFQICWPLSPWLCVSPALCQNSCLKDGLIPVLWTL